MLTDFGQTLSLSSKTYTIPVPQTLGPALMLLNSINFVHPNPRPAKAFPIGFTHGSKQRLLIQLSAADLISAWAYSLSDTNHPLKIKEEVSRAFIWPIKALSGGPTHHPLKPKTA